MKAFESMTQEVSEVSERQKLSNNAAGIEFAVCLEEIKEFLAKSWKYARIHRQLKESGRITMSYGAFCYHIRRLSLDSIRLGDMKPRITSSRPTHKARPRVVMTSNKKFPDPREMNPDEAL